MSLVTGVLLARAANLGGQIRHPEIAAPAGVAQNAHDLGDDHDHD